MIGARQASALALLAASSVLTQIPYALACGGLDGPNVPSATCTSPALAAAALGAAAAEITPRSPQFTTLPPIPPPPRATGGTGFSSAVPVTSYTFSPYPLPTRTSVPGVFPEVDPQRPPPPGATAIPNFAPAWKRAYEKARDKIAGFSLEQKVAVTTGVGWMNGRCVGNIPPIGDWPGLCLDDSPLGVRLADYVTAFPPGINAAATFNRYLIRQRGLLMGLEHRSKGVHVALGPMTNMARVAQGGRNWEGFGGDPYLSGEATYETVLGLQQAGVAASVKHLIANEQEYKRKLSSSDVDDRTMHEVYMHPFLRGVMAGAATMMCSYNLVNNTYACENDKVMNDILKREYGFQGYVMSDWQATHSTISAITGLDMTMPGDVVFFSNTTYFGANLTNFVQTGIIPESRVDDMATRILAGWYLLGQDSPSYPAVNFDAYSPDDDTVNEHIDVQRDHYKFVRTMGAASTVLLKNERGALPLGGGCAAPLAVNDERGYLPKRGGEGVYWQDDYGRPLGGGSASGCRNAKPLRSLVLVGSDAGPGRVGPNSFADQKGVDGVLAMGWGSGTANFTYLVNPLEAIQRRARRDRTSVSWILDDSDLPRAGNLAVKKDAAIVFVNSNSGEGGAGDRTNLTAFHDGDELILAVAEQNSNTIVVVHAVGPILVERWIDHPNVTAVLWAGLPGQEAGNSLVDVLYGDWNPSGRLPYTIARRVEDYSAQLLWGGGGPQDILAIPYTDALEIDYRYFDANKIKPRFEFGFGLSYTTFEYSDLEASEISAAWNTEDTEEAGLIQAWLRGEATPISQGSSTALWLHRPAFLVSFKIRNTGDRDGGEIPQLYIHMPSSEGEPPSLLRGFTNVEINPGETQRVRLTLSRYDLSVWDTVGQGWRKPRAQVTGGGGKAVVGLSVGRSSRDFRLEGRLEV